ncbi:MAG: type I restriction-modification system subunit M N-terminal domain-containing protein [Bacteroidota bacterium]
MKEKDISFEDKLWKAADRLRKKVEVHEYKYVVLGLIFLRYLSFAFDEKRKSLQQKENDIPGLRIMGIDKTFVVDWDNVPYCKISPDEYKNYKLKDKDPVISRIADII